MTSQSSLAEDGSEWDFSPDIAHQSASSSKTADIDAAWAQHAQVEDTPAWQWPMSKQEATEAAWGVRFAPREHSQLQRPQLRSWLSEQQNHRCCYCGVRLTDCRNAPTIEHILPQCYGGTDLVSNLVVACLGCNNARNNDIWQIHLDYFAQIGFVHNLKLSEPRFHSVAD